MHWRGFLLLLLLFAPCSALQAASVEPMTIEERIERAGAVLTGTVSRVLSWRDGDGLIYSEAVILVGEVFKGVAPDAVALRYRGGNLALEGETTVGIPFLAEGDTRLFFLSRGQAGQWVAVGGPDGALPLGLGALATAEGSGAEEVLAFLRQHLAPSITGDDLSAQEVKAEPPVAFDRDAAIASAGSYLLTPPRRFILADRGEVIRYRVDAAALPAGMTLSVALEAVARALEAWETASSVRFQFEGLESFGTSANNIATTDERLRIQLHDLYGAIGASGVLGIGGQGFTWTADFAAGGSGGRVYAQEFHRATRGFVVLRHQAPALQNVNTFEATLTHEIGHALGLAHSSEVENEPNAHLREAIMYYRMHNDGRGATLNVWDRDAAEAVHPVANPPPFGFDRVVRAVTASAPLTHPEVNQIQLRGYSLGGVTASPVLHLATSNNGSFVLGNGILGYNPAGAFTDSPELDPAGGQFYDRAVFRFDDGLHLSPPVTVRIIQFLRDTRPAGGPDGLPDSWMNLHFGAISPVSGVSGAMDDGDGDGLTNLQEFLLGTDPRSAGSRLAVTSLTSEQLQFSARPHEVYELQESEDLVNWSRLGAPLRPTVSTGTFPLPGAPADRRFYRIERVK